MKHRFVRLTPELRKRIERIAKRRKKSLNALAQDAIRAFLQQP